jgi:hypothetical protein
MQHSTWWKKCNGGPKICNSRLPGNRSSAQHLVNIKTRYLKKVDSFQNNHVHTFLTGGNVKFMLLMNADPLATPYSNFASPPPSRSTSARQSTLIANNPSSSQTEDAVRGFVTEVSLLLAMSGRDWEYHLPSLLTECFKPAGLRSLGEMHDESILRRQPGDNEPDLPQ